MYQTFFLAKNTNIDALATPINKMQPLANFATPTT